MQIDQHIRLKRLARLLDVSPKTVGRWVREGKFPKPIYIGGEPRWRVTEVAVFLEKQKSADETKEGISALEGCPTEDKPEHLGTSAQRGKKRD